MKFSKHFDIHFKVINYWLGFVLFLIVISNLPHQPIPTLSWMNITLYFLLFLQSFYLFRQNKSNRFIFLNICIFALFQTLGFVNIFIGESNFIRSDYLAYYIWEYRKILLSVFFSFSIVFICIKYLFRKQSALFHYALSIAIILPTFLWHYLPFILDKEYILRVENTAFYKAILGFNLFPLLVLVFYGILLYKYDRSLGAYINTLMVCFFITNLMNITALVGYIYNITIFSMSQYVLVLVLSFFLGTMFRLLNHVYSEFGQFYDSIVVNGDYLGVPIKRKKSAAFSLLGMTRAYFEQKPNAVACLALFFVFCINYFQVSLYFKLNMAVLSFGAMVLFFYLTALYQKRLRDGDLVTQPQSSK